MSEQNKELTEELKRAAEGWRAGIEERWEREWQPYYNGTTGYVKS
ncbi:MAG: hypothetical protein QGF00_02475 [Planctomycetota bacterium]|jgi:hypothetical protein|nr:hypothetical protein [Planctomycetota bacterium]MDP7248441.1 hypothetical protein [Planctomycetota bacterium]